MNVLRLSLVCSLALLCFPRDAAAVISPFTPDAWTRGNNADTSWFGWDVIELGANPTLYPYPIPNPDPELNFPGGPFRILDDSTPDPALGGGITTALNPRLFQGNDGLGDPLPTISGHRSGSGNYYSGFEDVSHDRITAIAPASGVGGFTTVVLQVLGQPNNEVNDLEFSMDAAWTKVKDLYARNENNSGMYWQEWTAPGNDLPLSILMTSTASSRGLDSFQVDTFWTSDRSPRINSITAIPEPGSIALAGIALISSLFVLRKRHVV